MAGEHRVGESFKLTWYFSP